MIPSFPNYGETDLNILAISKTGETKNYVVQNINSSYPMPVTFNSIQYTPQENFENLLYTVYDSLGEPRTILLSLFSFTNYSAPPGFTYIDSFTLRVLFFYESLVNNATFLNQFVTKYTLSFCI